MEDSRSAQNFFRSDARIVVVVCSENAGHNLEPDRTGREEIVIQLLRDVFDNALGLDAVARFVEPRRENGDRTFARNDRDDAAAD